VRRLAVMSWLSAIDVERDLPVEKRELRLGRAGLAATRETSMSLASPAARR